MKLYYDMLIPFMPDSEMDQEGKLSKSATKIAGRKAMIELSNFQDSGNITCLYNAVLQACIYADVDVINTIANLSTDIEIPEVSIQEAVDMCARMLFKSVNPANPFDINTFVAILLTSTHFALESIRSATVPQEAESIESDGSEDKQVTIDDIISGS